MASCHIFCYSPCMNEKCSGFSKINFKRFVVVLFICLIGLFTAEMIYFKSSLKNSIKRNENVLSMTCTLLDAPFKQAQELSRMLLSNPDIIRFIYQAPLNEGSSDIQKLIDAKDQLSFSKMINPKIEEVYIYSKTSNYLISNTNAYMNISRMYDSLFAFSGLNYLQWKDIYLSSKTKCSFYPSCRALVDGSEKEVIPYVHSFPLDHSIENSGKIILLLNKDYFMDIFEDLTLGKKGFAYISTLEGVPIISKGNIKNMDQYLNTEMGKVAQKMKINGKNYYVVQVISETFKLKYVFVIDPNIYYSEVFIFLMFIILALIVLLAISSILSTKMIINNKKRFLNKKF